MRSTRFGAARWLRPAQVPFALVLTALAVSCGGLEDYPAHDRASMIT